MTSTYVCNYSNILVYIILEPGISVLSVIYELQLIAFSFLIFTGTSIGKRYARTDELGVPFAITVDSTKDVTIRERDSKLQVRVDVEEAASVVKSVTDGQRTWEDVWANFPHHTSRSVDN